MKTKTVEGVEIVMAPAKTETPLLNSDQEVAIGKLNPGQRFKVNGRIGVVERQSNGWTEVQFDGESTTTISKTSSVVPTNGEEIDMKAKQKSKERSETKTKKTIKKESKQVLKTERKQKIGPPFDVVPDKKKSNGLPKDGTMAKELHGFLTSTKNPTHESLLKTLAEKFPKSKFGKSGATVDSTKLKRKISYWKSHWNM